jgi:hypothetical protein
VLDLEVLLTARSSGFFSLQVFCNAFGSGQARWHGGHLHWIKGAVLRSPPVHGEIDSPRAANALFADDSKD